MDTFKNFAIAQVVTPPSPPLSGASLAITPGTGAYMPPVPFTITVFDGAAYATPINAELIRVTAIVGDTLSGLVRTIEGSTARAIKAGDYVAQTFTAQFLADLRDSSNQNTGTLPDARLSANVALENAANVFTQTQAVSAPAAGVVLIDTSAPVDARRFNLLNATQALWIQATDDANGVQQGVVYVTRAGLVVAQGLGTTPLDAAQLSSGTVPDARLSANVARRDQANTFSQNQVIAASIPRLTLIDTSAAADKRVFQILNYSERLQIDVLNDAQSAYAGPTTALDRAGNFFLGGDLYEKSRPTPLGHWIVVPYSAANFGATGGTWTVTAANIARFEYTLIGKTALIQLWIDGSVVAGAPSSLNIVMPFTILSGQSAPCWYYVAPDIGWGSYVQPGQDQYLRLQRDPYATPFAAASAAAIRFSAAVQIL